MQETLNIISLISGLMTIFGIGGLLTWKTIGSRKNKRQLEIKFSKPGYRPILVWLASIYFLGSSLVIFWVIFTLMRPSELTSLGGVGMIVASLTILGISIGIFKMKKWGLQLGYIYLSVTGVMMLGFFITQGIANLPTGLVFRELGRWVIPASVIFGIAFLYRPFFEK